MLKQRGWTALALLLGLAVAVLGQDKDKDTGKDKDKPVLLQWKFEKDKTFFQEMKTDTQQTMKVMGSEVAQKQDQTFVFSWTPLKEEGGNWTVKQEIKAVKMKIDIGGQKIEYDSKNKQQGANPLSDFFKALEGSEFTLTIDKAMKVTKLEGREKFIDVLVKANPQMKDLLTAILSEEALKEMADPTFAAIPNKEVKKGDSWKKTTKLSMGPIGTYENEYTYTYEGPEKDRQRIKVEAKLTYQPPPETAGTAGLPFKIKSADLKSTKAEGFILFDTEKGRVDKSEMDVNLDGDLSIEIGGQTTKVTLIQKQKTTVTTSDKQP